MMKFGYDAIRNLELTDKEFDAYSYSSYEIGVDEEGFYNIYDSYRHDPSTIVGSGLSAQEVASFFESLTMPDYSLDERWELLVECGIATNDELKLVCSINGYNEASLDDVLYERTGFAEFKDFYWEVINV